MRAPCVEFIVSLAPPWPPLPLLSPRLPLVWGVLRGPPTVAKHRHHHISGARARFAPPSSLQPLNSSPRLDSNRFNYYDLGVGVSPFHRPATIWYATTVYLLAEREHSSPRHRRNFMQILRLVTYQLEKETRLLLIKFSKVQSLQSVSG